MFNPYIILAVFLSVVGAAGGGYWKGHSDADRSAEVQRLTDRNADLQITITASNAAREADAKTLTENEARLRDLQTKADDYAQAMEDRDTVCFSPADTRSLSDLFRLPR